MSQHLPMPAMSATAWTSFWTNIETNGPLGCWPWVNQVVTSPRSSDAYGRVDIAGKKYLAHRLAYAFIYGDPGDLQVDHAETCTTKRCVNPNHLLAMTGQQNTSKWASYRTTCKQGHPYDDTMVNGLRRCVPCHNAANRRAYATRRAVQA